MGSHRARIVLFAATLAVSLSALPLVAQAHVYKATKAFSSCTRDFAGELHAQVVAKHYVGAYREPLGVMVRPQRMKLTARNARTDHVVGRAVCTFNSFGKVVGFSSKPPTPSPASY